MTRETIRSTVPDDATRLGGDESPQGRADQKEHETTLDYVARAADRRQLQYLYVRKLIADGMDRAWNEVLAAREREMPASVPENSQVTEALTGPSAGDERSSV